MYEARFTTKQIYDNYKNAVGNTTPKPTNARSLGAFEPDPAQRTSSKKLAKSRSLGAFEPDPAQRTSSTVQTKSRSSRDRRGSTYDEVPQSIVQRPEPKPVKETAYEKVLRVFNEAMEGFGVFDEPTQPTYDTVDTMNVYKDKRYFGPQVYSPDIDFKDPSLKDVTPKFFADPDLPPIYKNLNTDRLPTLPENKTNIFGANKDNPSLNMFGLRRGFTEPPAGLMSPPSVEVPANMDPVTRILSQAMLPEPVEPTADYTTKAGDTLFSIQKTLKENGINTTVEEIAEINDIGLDGIFGIKPGTELKLPMPSTDAAPKEVKAALEKLTPITMTEDKSILEQLKESTEYYKKLAADALGINIETDQEKLNKAAGLMEPQKVTTAKTKANITAYQNKLNSLGFYSGRADGVYGKITKNGIKMYQKRNGLTVTGEMNEETANRLNSGNSIVPTSIQVGNLTVSTAYRDEIDPSQLVIATDFNGGGPNAKFGAEVVLPPAVFNAGPGNQHYDAAVKYLDLVKDFFEKKGYGEYALRDSNVVGGQAGIKRSGQNPSGFQSGRGNTIHLEGFFGNDTKAANIVKENKEEFFDLYIQAFGTTTGAILTAPHGKISEKNRQDQGAVSPILGTETSLGDETITHIMKKYGNR